MAAANSASDLARANQCSLISSRVSRSSFLDCEHRFGLLVGLIELLNEVGRKRTVGSGLCSRHHDTLPRFFRISKCVNWRRHPFGDLNTGMVRTWRELGAGRMASALQKISSPRSRKKRTRAFSVPTAEKFEKKLACARPQEDATVELNSSQSQKVKRSRKLRLPETMRETMARSASVPMSVSIKSS